MTIFADLTRAVTCRYSDRIRKFCSPLLEHFNLSHFGYYKLKASGGYVYLGTHVEWSEYFAAEKLYTAFPYYRHPKYFQGGISFTKGVRDAALTELFDCGKAKFNINQSLMVMKQTLDGIEGYCFTPNSPDEMQIAMLCNEMPMLQLFIDKFHSDNKFLFDQLADNEINLAQLMGPTFYAQQAPVTSQPVSKRLFLEQLGVELEESLSKADYSVMRLLIRGYSASQIGQRLFRSKRTIEHRIERIKEKLLCGSKSELIQKSKALESFGLLDESFCLGKIGK